MGESGWVYEHDSAIVLHLRSCSSDLLELDHQWSWLKAVAEADCIHEVIVILQ